MLSKRIFETMWLSLHEDDHTKTEDTNGLRGTLIEFLLSVISPSAKLRQSFQVYKV